MGGGEYGCEISVCIYSTHHSLMHETAKLEIASIYIPQETDLSCCIICYY